MPETIECIGEEGKPQLYIQTIYSYEFPYAFGQGGFIRFYGSYRIHEKMEPGGTDLDAYETKFCLPQFYSLLVTSDNVKTVYVVEVYKRVLHTQCDEFNGMDQTIFFNVINQQVI